MKWVLLAGLLLTSSLTWAADFAEPDKEKHIMVSAGISLASYSVFRAQKVNRVRSFLYSLALTLAVGHLKESTDPYYDSEDMQANAVGSGIMLIPLSLTF